MPYTRRISVADAVPAGYPGYRVVIVASPESATVLAGFLSHGGHPPLHTHDVDLFYVVLEGSTTVRLGHENHQAKAGEVIYIPAGLPHGSENRSGAAECHLEILIPGVRPGSPVLRPLGSADEVPLPATAPYAASTSGPPTETVGHETRWVLTGEPAGAGAARVTAVQRTGPEDPGPPASRDSDRLVVVTEGELTAEIAARPAAVPAQAVIVIPADAPHRIWNSSTTPVRYLDADIPAPDAYAKLAP
jgi:mannose-6-phosphate isomerase-like protein (cupin superfamily)